MSENCKSVSVNKTHQHDTVTTAAVSCSHVCLGYNGEWVLENVNLDIPEGAFMPFVGPNGGGKTTLLRGILGLLRPECGHIQYGRPDLQLGYVPQQKSIDPLFPISVEQIVTMGFYRKLGWWRRPGKTQKTMVAEVLDEVGLSEHASKNYRDLSGGMKQKALIARALVSGADVLILDEPTSELDAPSEREVIGHLFRLCHEMGKTILIACHGIQLAVTLSDQVCLVEKGQARIVDTRQARQYTSMDLHVESVPVVERITDTTPLARQIHD